MTHERTFDDTLLRREYDYAMPYDRLKQRHTIDGSTPRPEVTNSVFEVEYFADDDGTPPLWDRWMLAGGCMSDCIVRNDKDPNYVMRVCMPNSKQVCSIILHTNRCIVSGTRSIADLVVVCNTLVRCVRERFKPHGASFHVGSFRNKLHNTVALLNVSLPFAFSRIEPLLRPNNAVRRSDESAPAAMSSALLLPGAPLIRWSTYGGLAAERAAPAASAVATGTDHIPHYMLTINVAAPSSARKKRKPPVLKMYEHAVGDGGGAVSKLCLSGIRSIDRAKDMLLEFYFFMIEHRAALLYTPDELHRMQMLHDAAGSSSRTSTSSSRPKKRHRFD